MKRKVSLYFCLLLTCIIIIISGSVIYSQDSTGTSNTTINGFVDVYFSKNFASPANETNKYRNFDVAENQFDISLAKIIFQKAASPIGFRLDLAFGHTIDLVNNDASLGSEKSLRNLEQAYFTAIIPVGNRLTINAGKMVTHMGYEVIESPSNINYSRSLMFAYAIPYFHLGAMASYPFSNQFTATIYIYNGWNNISETNKEKTLGVTLNWTPVNNLSIIENWIGGAEEPDSISTNKRHVFDTIINYTLSDKIFLSINADYGFEKQPNGDLAIWKGFAVIGKYSLCETSALALRGEVYSDPYGFTTGTIQELKEITFTYEQKFLPNLLVRLEYRRDWSNVKVFDEGNKTGTKTDQNTILISSVISF